jgi:outer membrane protein assembly factor BamB
LATDDAGDVVIAGDLSSLGPQRVLVTKLAGATGSQLWQQTITSDDRSQRSLLAIDAANAVVLVLGTESGRAILVKLASDTGQVAWRRELGGVRRLFALAPHPEGDVFATGQFCSAIRGGAFRGCRFEILRLAGSDARPRWRRSARVGGMSRGGGAQLAIGGGHAVAAGAMTRRLRRPYGGRLTNIFTVFGLCARDGGAGPCK